MKYDIFLIYTREDSAFAKNLAKAMEMKNLRVLYQDSLSVAKSMKEAIEKGNS